MLGVPPFQYCLNMHMTCRSGCKTEQCSCSPTAPLESCHLKRCRLGQQVLGDDDWVLRAWMRKLQFRHSSYQPCIRHLHTRVLMFIMHILASVHLIAYASQTLAMQAVSLCARRSRYQLLHGYPTHYEGINDVVWACIQMNCTFAHLLCLDLKAPADCSAGQLGARKRDNPP